MDHPSFPEVAIVGMHFRGAWAVEYASALQGGELFELEPEPENPHDPNALKVLTDSGEHWGYIERGQAAWITPHIEDGADYLVEITRTVPYKNTVRVYCTVRPRDTA